MFSTIARRKSFSSLLRSLSEMLADVANSELIISSSSPSSLRNLDATIWKDKCIIKFKISDSFFNNSYYSDMKALYSLPLISRRVLKMEWMKHSWGSLNKAFPSKSKLNYKNIRWFIHYFTFWFLYLIKFKYLIVNVTNPRQVNMESC